MQVSTLNSSRTLLSQKELGEVGLFYQPQKGRMVVARLHHAASRWLCHLVLFAGSRALIEICSGSRYSTSVHSEMLMYLRNSSIIITILNVIIL